jgi:hypothetical protein
MNSTSESRPVVVHRGSSREDVGRDGRRVLDRKPTFTVDAELDSIFTSASEPAANISPSSNCDQLLDPSSASRLQCLRRWRSVSVRAEWTVLATITSITERDSVTLKPIVALIRCRIPREVRFHFCWTTTVGG